LERHWLTLIIQSERRPRDINFDRGDPLKSASNIGKLTQHSL
jgi:hypothetical protein